MQAIILAAGRGERLMPLTANMPKVLLPLWDGECILQKQLKVFKSIPDISEVIIVTGYLTEKIEAKIKEWGYDEFVKIAYNPFHKVSNNLVSLWFGSQKIREDVIITNGDNIFKRDVIETLTDAGDNGAFLVVDKKESYDDDDMKVTIDEGRIVKVSKRIPPNETSAESTGIALFAGDGREKLITNLERLVRIERYLGMFWLEVFNVLAKEGFSILPVWISENDWHEMDIHSDKQLINLLLQSKKI